MDAPDAYDLSSDQIDKLIKVAIEKGNEFSESFKAIIYYLLNIESSDDIDKLNAKLFVNLMLETINLHDEVKGRFTNVSLQDNIRLAAQQVVESYKNLDKMQE